MNEMIDMSLKRGKGGGREGGRAAWLPYLLPRPVRHHQGGVANVTAYVIEPLVLGEGAMAAIVAYHEEAPHEKAWGGRGGGRGEEFVSA